MLIAYFILGHIRNSERIPRKSAQSKALIFGGIGNRFQHKIIIAIKVQKVIDAQGKVLPQVIENSVAQVEAERIIRLVFGSSGRVVDLYLVGLPQDVKAQLIGFATGT